MYLLGKTLTISSLPESEEAKRWIRGYETGLSQASGFFYLGKTSGTSEASEKLDRVNHKLEKALEENKILKEQNDEKDLLISLWQITNKELTFLGENLNDSLTESRLEVEHWIEQFRDLQTRNAFLAHRNLIYDLTFHGLGEAITGPSEELETGFPPSGGPL